MPTALFFKAMQGFLESGPQATLQLSLLFYGSSSKSKQMLIEPYLPTSLNQSIFMSYDGHGVEDYEGSGDEDDSDTAMAFKEILNGSTDSIDIFGRVYDKGKTVKVSEMIIIPMGSGFQRLGFFTDDRYWFGWIHTLSVIISFLSIFITSISFNELEANHPSSVVVLAGDPDGLPGTPVIDTASTGSGRW